MKILHRLGADGKAAVRVVVIGNSRTTVTEFGPHAGAVVAAAPTADLAGPDPGALLGLSGQDAAIVVVSVVPAGTAALLERVPGAIVMRHAQARIRSAYAPPGSLGVDRLANALAARAIYGSPVLAIDCGTATTFTLVDAAGTLAGGAIALGLGASRDALALRTAQLPEVPLEVPPAALATDTRTGMQVGLVLGHAGMVSHLARQIAPGVPMVLTGGWSGLLCDLVPGAVRHENLTACGGRVYWDGLMGGDWRAFWH